MANLYLLLKELQHKSKVMFAVFSLMFYMADFVSILKLFVCLFICLSVFAIVSGFAPTDSLYLII